MKRSLWDKDKLKESNELVKKNYQNAIKERMEEINKREFKNPEDEWTRI